MKKNLIGLILIIAFAMILVACKEPHAHTFKEEWATDGTNHWHESTCGCDVVDGKMGHSWDITHKTLPNCTQTGTDTYTCTVCGYAEDRLVAKKHTWDNGVTVKFATCDQEGAMIKHCTLCGEVDTKNITIGKLTTHIWEDGSVSGNNVVFTCEHSADHTNTVAIPTGEDPDIFTEMTKMDIMSVFTDNMESLFPLMSGVGPGAVAGTMSIIDSPVTITLDGVDYDCIINGIIPTSGDSAVNAEFSFAVENYKPFNFSISSLDKSVSLEGTDKTNLLNYYLDTSLLRQVIPSELEFANIPSIISTWTAAEKPKKTSDSLYIRTAGDKTEITMKGYSASGADYSFTITGVIIVDSENKILSMNCDSFAYTKTLASGPPRIIPGMKLEYTKNGSAQTFRINGILIDNSRVSFSV